jgi:Adenosylmethionine decarboxylase
MSVDYDNFSNVIDKVVKAFNPGKFSTTVFVRSSSVLPPLLNGNVRGFRQRDSIIQNLGKWQLYFAHYDSRAEFRHA